MTQEYLNKYADIIVKTFLGLEKDDLLSLNTEEKDMEFARVVADKAISITKNVVKLVVTEDGKVQDVVDFEPDFPAGQGKGFAMLHLVHVSPIKKQEGRLLDTVVDKEDFPSLQKLGHLADPQILGRRISVPFCVVPVFENGDPRESELLSKLDSDIESLVLACTYRSQFFHQADVHRYFVEGNDCKFNFEVPEDVYFPCGSVILSNGRKYVPSIDFDKIIIPVCKNSLDGVFFAEFEVFGRKQSGKFVYKDGNLISYPDSAELKRFFDYEKGTSKPGFIKAGDKFFCIYLGGSNTDVLDSSVEEFPEYFNECPYCLKLTLPSDLNAFFEDCECKRKEIQRKGFFLE